MHNVLRTRQSITSPAKNTIPNRIMTTLNGFINNEALANEMAAGFYRVRGLAKIANAYLQDARTLYAHWGAHGKVKQLDERYHLREERTSASLASIGPLVAQLDIETIVKALQALSSEMILPRLIEKLVRIAVEHAGPQRGMLILIRDDEPRIEAEATTGPGRIEVSFARSRLRRPISPNPLCTT
jgi:GAF domain-containing protein